MVIEQPGSDPVEVDIEVVETYTLKTAFTTSEPGLTVAECEVEAEKIMAANPDAAPYMVPDSEPVVVTIGPKEVTINSPTQPKLVRT